MVSVQGLVRLIDVCYEFVMKLKFSNLIWIVLAVFSTIFILVVLMKAYSGGIPSFIGSIPYYDKIGHFVLYGIWSYLFWRASRRTVFYMIPLTPALITVFTVVEEYLQVLSPNRTASFADLFFSLMGIWLVIVVDRRFR